MFGVLRTTFALMVMAYHLFIGILPLGLYAVFGFYIISGYLMTLIMHESYGYSGLGKYSFAVNRCLRLYPQYWLAALFSLVLILLLGPDAATSYNKNFYIPHSVAEAFHNFFMAYIAWFPNEIRPRLVPPTWALTVEIFFYILIGLGISKTAARVKIWLIASLCYVPASYLLGWSWNARYFPVAAASLPFAIGSTIYFASKKKLIAPQLSRVRLSSRTLFLLMLVNCLVWMILSKRNIGNFVDMGFYLNIVICALLVYRLAIGKEILAINRKWDKVIGDYSYPIYLLHWQSGFFVSYLIFGKTFHEYSARGFISLLGSVVFVVLLSSFFIRGIDEPIQRIRSKIKANRSLRQQLEPHSDDR